MKSNSKQWARDLRLYIITDRKLFSASCSVYMGIEDILSAGAKSIQLREKDLPTRELLDMAYWMRELTNEYDAKLFINDRVDIALAVQADGVQLGQSSIPAHAARKASNDSLLIGVSTHSIDEAVRAESEGADFITLGPIFETPSKMKYGRPIGIDTIRHVKSRVTLPVIAIGGINLERIPEVLHAGSDGVAVISAILTAENIEKTTEDFLRILK